MKFSKAWKVRIDTFEPVITVFSEKDIMVVRLFLTNYWQLKLIYMNNVNHFIVNIDNY